MAQRRSRKKKAMPKALHKLQVLDREPEQIEEDPILDASFLIESSAMQHQHGQTPIDVMLAERNIQVSETQMQGSRDAVRALVENGLVSHIVLCWTQELALARLESEEWTKWIRRVTAEGKHLRASVSIRYGEYRRNLAKSQLAIGQAIINEVRKSAIDKPTRAMVQSFLPRGYNPLATTIANGQNPLVEGTEPSGAEIANGFNKAEADPLTNLSELAPSAK
jgi:hypothetical protein